MTKLYIFLAIYLLSVFATYYAIRREYINEWKTISPDLIDVLFVLMPVVNTALAILIPLIKWMSNVNVSKFFRIKR